MERAAPPEGGWLWPGGSLGRPPEACGPVPGWPSLPWVRRRSHAFQATEVSLGQGQGSGDEFVNLTLLRRQQQVPLPSRQAWLLVRASPVAGILKGRVIGWGRNVFSGWYGPPWPQPEMSGTQLLTDLLRGSDLRTTPVGRLSLLPPALGESLLGTGAWHPMRSLDPRAAAWLGCCD